MLRPNDDYIHRLIETVNNSPFPRHLPMKLASIELDHAVVACETATCHLQPFGIVHGGVLATLIDTHLDPASDYNDIASDVIAARDSETGEPFNREELIDNMVGFIAAGLRAPADDSEETCQ